MEDLVSVVIPSRNERYLNNTLKSLLENSGGDIEIVVVLDGDAYEKPMTDNRVRYLKNEEPKGMRQAINQAAAETKGKYLMKCDAHCAFDKDFDLKLKKDCKPDWTVVPRRYAIDKRNWTKHPNPEYFYDFQYIGHPDDPDYSFKGVDWPEYGNRCKGKKICDLMTSQGSCWFMFRDRFYDLEGLDDKNYGSMGAEAQEISLKAWLSGGRYVLNRNTWYAHKKKRTSVKHRGYRKPVGQWRKSRAFIKECFLNDAWGKQTRKLEWLVKRFKPVPGWHTKFETVKSNRYIRHKYNFNYGCDGFPRVIKDMNRDELVKLWRNLGYKLGCEVGVEMGLFSQLMYKNIPGLTMYLVDPYLDYRGSKRRGSRHNKHEGYAHKKLDRYNPIWMKELSETAFNKIPDGYLDFVYIDGNHDYDFVMLDILLWQRKVKPGGMVSGHDYQTDRRPYTRHVKVAVDNYTDLHEIAPWYLTDVKNQRTKADRHASWFWIKE